MGIRIILGLPETLFNAVEIKIEFSHLLKRISLLCGHVQISFLALTELGCLLIEPLLFTLHTPYVFFSKIFQRLHYLTVGIIQLKKRQRFNILYEK